LQVARAALHFWEEPPLSGSGGSGTIFFSNCSLHCVYCQNLQISRGQVGAVISIERLAEIFSELQAQGAQNINLVTPTHYLPEIIAALELSRAAGLTIPIVYNTSGYERADVIAKLAGYVDIFLTDLRYTTPALAARYSSAPDYPAVATAALETMLQVTKPYQLDALGILQSGIIVRFLLLPGYLAEAKQAVAKVFAICGNAVCYSLMNQFTPSAACSARFPELSCTVNNRDYNELIDFALNLGVGTDNSFIQEGGSAKESFIPAFDLTGVLRKN
jgi:putative pyruvate formate lyase activating enzyme